MRYQDLRRTICERSEPERLSGRLLRGLALLAAVVWGVAAPRPLRAQDISVYPPVLYSGLNVITITAPNGLSRILRGSSAGWSDLVSGLNTPQYKIISGPSFSECARKATFIVFVKTMNTEVNLHLRAIDCRRNTERITLGLENTWNVYREEFGNVTLGATACRTFQVGAEGGEFIVDSIGSPAANFQIRYTGGRPPLRIPSSGIFYYSVCFNATKLGRVRMPIYVFLRRRYPAGGQNTFVVSDTAYVNVVPSPIAQTPRTPPAVRPVPPKNPPLVAQPPALIIPKQPPPPDTPKVIPRATAVRLRQERMTPAPVERPAITGRAETEPTFTQEFLTDPTTHRVVIMPTARPIDSGKIFLSNYELAGWLAGYGVNDRLSLLGGVLYVPSFISNNLVVTAGGRYEVYRQGAVQGAVGAQGNYSRSDLSSIILLSPYGVASVGDDDKRASLLVGYTWRRHFPADSGVAPFNKSAVVLGVGGDYRLGEHWKVAAEAFLLQEAEYQPLVLTLRYFGRRFAIDGGLGVDLGLLGGRTDGIRLAPVLTGTWVF